LLTDAVEQVIEEKKSGRNEEWFDSEMSSQSKRRTEIGKRFFKEKQGQSREI
jgi:hypothetical protein